MRAFLFCLLFILLLSPQAAAFCGFYVAKADTKLFNDSSKVIIAHDSGRTILTMANDYRGDVSEFAMVVPVPTVLTQDQVQVGDNAIIDRLDAYSAPRLVEYFDDDPCIMGEYEEFMLMDMAMPEVAADEELERARALGVTIEEQFSVGEYDILMLSATQSEGLETWLLENGYRIPEGAAEVFTRYINMGMKFFVAKVNLEAFTHSGQVFLRPLLMAFESDALMLPIQLGTINAEGHQDLIVFLLSPEGRIETSNYRTAKIPSDTTLPEFIEDDFGAFYQAMFQTASSREGNGVVMLEYAWDMSWCDPCAADPLSADELSRAGVFWLNNRSDFGAPNVYLTRLHLRYTAESHPEDLMFRITDNRENFQGRFILQRPFNGTITCEEGELYLQEVRLRQSQEAETLANLTGWPIEKVRSSISPYQPEVSVPSWWNRVFNGLTRP